MIMMMMMIMIMMIMITVIMSLYRVRFGILRSTYFGRKFHQRTDKPLQQLIKVKLLELGVYWVVNQSSIKVFLS